MGGGYGHRTCSQQRNEKALDKLTGIKGSDLHPGSLQAKSYLFSKAVDKRVDYVLNPDTGRRVAKGPAAHTIHHKQRRRSLGRAGPGKLAGPGTICTYLNLNCALHVITHQAQQGNNICTVSLFSDPEKPGSCKEAVGPFACVCALPWACCKSKNDLQPVSTQHLAPSMPSDHG